MNERRWNLLGACVVSTIGLIIAGMTMGTWWAMVGLSIATFGFYGSKGPFWAMPPMFLTGTAAAATIAWINSIGNLGGFFGPWYVGAMKDVTGSYAGGLYGLAFLCLISSVVCAFWLHIPNAVSGQAQAVGSQARLAEPGGIRRRMRRMDIAPSRVLNRRLSRSREAHGHEPALRPDHPRCHRLRRHRRRRASPPMSASPATASPRSATLARRAPIARSLPTGKALAPGFIDAHTHDDRAVLCGPECMLCKMSQGVTTVVVGNCGISLSPVRMKTRPVPPLDLLGDESWWTFDSFADYAERLARDPSPVNTYALIGHMSLRVEAMDGDTQRAATDKEAAHMQRAAAPRRWRRARPASPPACTIRPT